MKPAKQTKGDFFQWLWTQTASSVMSIVNKNQWRRRPYFIMLQIGKGYAGQPTGLHKVGHRTTNIKVEGKKLIHKIFSILDRDPGARLDTVLWRIDNLSGKVELVRSLPRDYPFAVEDSDNTGEVVESVAKEAEKIKPALMWN